ncbi:hypothetical protein SAMN05444277_108150 [Parafilimonas terrae]|uniref:Uncharacterized protein n=1 Tax=Parafilimonas terrae TaxID=1465490 RepID=A0A1I5XFK6_9BACT|nr:hypothetical protein SAMN05444277_108150 [Parafilimonas terrae]
MLQSRKQFLKSTCLLIGAGALLKHKTFSNYYLPSWPEGFCNYDLASVGINASNTTQLIISIRIAVFSFYCEFLLALLLTIFNYQLYENHPAATAITNFL